MDAHSPAHSLGLQLARRGPFGTKSSVRAHQELVELVLGGWFMAHQSADDGSDESQGNAQNAGVFQRKQRLRVDQVASPSAHGGRVDGHQTRG